LAIVAYPNLPPARTRNDKDERNAFYKAEAENAARLNSFAKIKGARVVRLANADRDIMRMNQPDVLTRVKDFIAELSRASRGRCTASRLP